MFSFLRRSPAAPERGAALFEAVTAQARQPHWYVEGKVPDTLDGRFAVLATITALVLVRVEGDGSAGQAASVALTERFITIMEAEHRELGLGDPTLGKQVRKLVGSLARRTELWQAATAGDRDWIEASRESLYKVSADADALAYCAEALRRLWEQLGAAALGDIEQGEL